MWTLVASTLAGRQLAEIDNASNREIGLLLNRTNTVSFQVPSSSPLTPYLASTDVIVDAYDGAVHRFRGRVVSYNRVAGEQGRSMAVVAADPSWVFPKRLIGKNASGGSITDTPQDRGAIVVALINSLNSERSTGIRTMVQPYLAGTVSTYTSGPFKPFSDALQDLSAGIYGFDWEVLPVRGVDDVLGDWHAAAIIGTYKPDAVFHYVEGGGGNMKEITDTVTKTEQADRVYHFLDFGVSTGTDPAIITSATDATTADIIANDGLYEDVASAQLMDAALRQSLVDAHVELRRWPRRVITFKPQDYDPSNPGTVPVFGVDYNLGDVVRARAEDQWGEWFDAYFRVYGWTAKPTSEGLETGEILLIDDGSGSGGGV